MMIVNGELSTLFFHLRKKVTLVTNELVPYVLYKDVDLSRLYIKHKSNLNAFVIITNDG